MGEEAILQMLHGHSVCPAVHLCAALTPSLAVAAERRPL
jgi:hypothetical protein